MKARPLVITLLIAAILIGIAVWQSKRSQTSATQSITFATGDRLIAGFPVNELHTVRLQGAENSVTLSRVEDRWVVTERENYPADFEKLARFLRQIQDLKPVQSVAAGPSQHPRLGLTNPVGDGGTGILFEGTAENSTTQLIIGNEFIRDAASPMAAGMAAGRYVRLADQPDRIWLISETLNAAEPEPSAWIDRRFVAIENPVSISVTPTGEDAIPWKLTRNEDSTNFTLEGLTEEETLDTAQTNQLRSVLAAATIEDVLTGDAADFEPARTATIMTADGFTYTLRIGEQIENNYPVKLTVTAELPEAREPGGEETEEDRERLDARFAEEYDRLTAKLGAEQKFTGKTFLLPNFAIQPLLKERATFIQAPEEPGAEE